MWLNNGNTHRNQPVLQHIGWMAPHCPCTTQPSYIMQKATHSSGRFSHPNEKDYVCSQCRAGRKWAGRWYREGGSGVEGRGRWGGSHKLRETLKAPGRDRGGGFSAGCDRVQSWGRLSGPGGELSAVLNICCSCCRIITIIFIFIPLCWRLHVLTCDTPAAEVSSLIWSSSVLVVGSMWYNEASVCLEWT